MCSPTIFVAMGASAGTASTLAAVSQIGLIAGGTMMSINAQKQAMRYQQQQAEFQAKQFKAKADGEYLQTQIEENERKKQRMRARGAASKRATAGPAFRSRELREETKNVFPNLGPTRRIRRPNFGQRCVWASDLRNYDENQTKSSRILTGRRFLKSTSRLSRGGIFSDKRRFPIASSVLDLRSHNRTPLCCATV